jgi:hypothetical protein
VLMRGVLLTGSPSPLAQPHGYSPSAFTEGERRNESLRPPEGL